MPSMAVKSERGDALDRSVLLAALVAGADVAIEQREQSLIAIQAEARRAPGDGSARARRCPCRRKPRRG